MKHALVLASTFPLFAGCGDMHSELSTLTSAPAPQEEVLHIHFERSGGFAGMMTNVDIDAYSLPDAERQALMTLVTDAGFFALPSDVTDPSTTGADRYNYRITIQSGARTHTVECVDGSAPASLVPLLDWLNDNARRGRRDSTPQP